MFKVSFPKMNDLMEFKNNISACFATCYYNSAVHRSFSWQWNNLLVASDVNQFLCLSYCLYVSKN